MVNSEEDDEFELRVKGSGPLVQMVYYWLQFTRSDFFCWVDILYCSDSVTNGDNSLVQVDFDDVMGVYSVKFSPKQQNLVVGCGNGAIQVNK